MSYVLHLGDDAHRGLAALPVEVQEETLDVLEGLTYDPARLIGRRPHHRDVVVDFMTHSAGSRYYVFMVVRPQHGSKTVYVKRLGHARREEPSSEES